MSDQLGAVQIEACGNCLAIETLSHGHTTGLSVIITPEQFASLVVRAEQLEPMMAFRRREAREMASTQARASRR